MDIMRAANKIETAGKSVIHFEVGQPYMGIPESTHDFVKNIITNKELGYTDSCGIPELRENISSYYKRTYGETVSPDSIIITSGSSAGIQLSLLAAFDVGDRVGIISPGYPAYKQLLSSLSLVPELIHVNNKNNYEPTVDMINRSSNLKGLILSSPSNPTGKILSKANMDSILDYCRINNIQIISDEIYHGISYDEPCHTTLSNSRDVIVVNSFSKYFCMTGWRVGWLVIPKRLSLSIERLAQNHYISPPAISQWVACEVINKKEELDKVVELYKKNREIVLENLAKIGITDFASPDGAFYIYANVQKLTNNSEELCERLLKEANIALTPGSDFDCLNGKKFIRISYSCSSEQLIDGMNRLKDWYLKDKA